MTTTFTTANTITRVTTTPVTVDPTDVVAAGPRPLWRAALASGAVAAAATTAIAAVAGAAGVSFEVDGEPIPLLGFAQMTLLGAVLGLVIAGVCRRFAHPRATFVRITVALTAVSVVPDFAMSFDTASRIVLVFCHVTAASIIVPVLARRLPAAR